MKVRIFLWVQLNYKKMWTNMNKKGISFIAVGELSEETKKKLNTMKIKKEHQLKKMVNDYKNSTLDK